MDGQSSDTEKIGQKTKNEDMQNRETQHRKLKKMRVMHMDHTKKKKKKKNPSRKKRDLVAFASVAELCPENHYCTAHKPYNIINGMLIIRKFSYHIRNKIILINNQVLFNRYIELFCITFMFLYRSEISV
jgi:uncharacterized protein involved in copper resistance